MIIFDNVEYNFNSGRSQTWAYYESVDPIQNVRLESSETWVTATVDHAEGTSGSIFLEVEENVDKDARTATIILTGYNPVERRDESATLTVNQDGRNIVGQLYFDNIYVDGVKTDNIRVNSSEHNLKFDVFARLLTSYSFINNYDWIVVQEERQDIDKYSYEFEILNNTGEDRVADILVTGKDVNGNALTNTLHIVQKQYEAHPVVFSVDDQKVSADGQNIILNIYSENMVSYSVTNKPNWVRVISSDLTKIELNIQRNTFFENRTGEVTFHVIGVDDEIDYTMTIEQHHAIFTGLLPTWVDYILPLVIDQDADDIYYDIYVGIGDDYGKIFSGHSYAYGGENPEINLTELIRSYVEVKAGINTLNHLLKDDYVVVDVFSSSDKDMANQDKIASVKYYYDYTFKTDPDEEFLLIKNDPIFNYVDSRQFLPVTVANPGGTKYLTISSQDIHEVITDEGTFTMFKVIDSHFDYIYVLYGENDEEIRTFDVKNTCAKYVLYYLNAHGGWDSLLFEGKCTKTNAYEKSTILKDFNNTKLEFGNEHYLKNITTTYRCTTNFISDEQSKKMYNVFQTTKAYLYSFEDGEMIPVLVNNNNYEVKSYRNNGRKLFTYTIEMQASQNKFSK